MSGCEAARKRQDAPINRRLAIDEARIKLKRLGPTLEGSRVSAASSPTRRRRKRAGSARLPATPSLALKPVQGGPERGPSAPGTLL